MRWIGKKVSGTRCPVVRNALTGKTLKSKFTEKTMIREIENRRSIRKYKQDKIDRNCCGWLCR